jgi:hypothetical protein
MNQSFTGRLINKNGRREFSSLTQSKQFEHYASDVPDGMIVECFYEITHDDGTLPQLAKLHVLIRQLATHVGETVENMKILIKDRAGLCISRNVAGKEYFLAKSFGDCSKEDLSLAIQAAMEIGEEINFPVG